MTVTVVVVEDHPMFRSGLRGVLDAHPDIEVLGGATTARDAVATISATRPG